MSWSYWILGEGICGAYRTALFFLLSPGPKTWYLNYALYGLFDASLTSQVPSLYVLTLIIFRGRREERRPTKGR